MLILDPLDEVPFPGHTVPHTASATPPLSHHPCTPVDFVLHASLSSGSLPTLTRSHTPILFTHVHPVHTRPSRSHARPDGTVHRSGARATSLSSSAKSTTTRRSARSSPQISSTSSRTSRAAYRYRSRRCLPPCQGVAARAHMRARLPLTHTPTRPFTPHRAPHRVPSRHPPFRPSRHTT